MRSSSDKAVHEKLRLNAGEPVYYLDDEFRWCRVGSGDRLEGDDEQEMDLQFMSRLRFTSKDTKAAHLLAIAARLDWKVSRRAPFFHQMPNNIHIYAFGPHYRYLTVYTALPTGQRISTQKIEPQDPKGPRRQRYDELVAACKEGYPKLRMPKYAPTKTEQPIP